MVKYVMVIDLLRCVGCGACVLACKIENNVSNGIYWMNYITKLQGSYPEVLYEYIPKPCFHCEKPPCVDVCPTHALHIIEGGIVMHDSYKCIGCRYCMTACPYESISYNNEKPHKDWYFRTSMVNECTSSPQEIVEKSGGIVIPYYNPDRGKTYAAIREKGVVEKCTFCDHRVREGKLPACVESCPADALHFGDLDDPDSEVSRLLRKYKGFRLKEHLGTEPKVYYIRSFKPETEPEPLGGGE
jgi:molybdopterin-containing oxidoreductase family iron-sulfur binding subunit